MEKHTEPPNNYLPTDDRRLTDFSLSRLSSEKSGTVPVERQGKIGTIPVERQYDDGIHDMGRQTTTPDAGGTSGGYSVQTCLQDSGERPQVPQPVVY